MALTRKFLAALGIEADKVEEIINAHVETVNGLKDEKEALQKKADQVDSLTEELNELKENSKNDGKYKVKYDALKTEFDEYKENQKKEATAKSVCVALNINLNIDIYSNEHINQM